MIQMNEKVELHIAAQFSDAPGARYRSDGDDSGEQFYEELLKPKFEEAMKKNTILFIDMDGTYGYATSFISHSFGSLSREFGKDKVLEILEIKSDEDEKLIEYVNKTIKNPDEFV